MLSVKVQFFSILSEITGAKELELTLKTGSKIEDLFNMLTEKYGADFKERIFDSKTGDLRRLIIVTVNGKDVRNMNRLKTDLNDGDEVAILPTVAGG
ncbi:MAG: MoaD family protein [Nitrososphaeria archaeon]|nr:MoaD family protein [Nitrososphaeria archaeon]NIQ33310.1 MoaD family protein [Nitrososphaeria archaeon]